MSPLKHTVEMRVSTRFARMALVAISPLRHVIGAAATYRLGLWAVSRLIWVRIEGRGARWQRVKMDLR